MNKIIVIGCPGSGKSTFSIELSAKMSIPIYHLDMMYWNADKTTVEKQVFLDRLCDVLKKDDWIIDGNYISTMESRLSICDTVFWLDYPVEICLDGIKERIGKKRPDMPWVETEEDIEFIDYIRKFNEEQRPTILNLLEKHPDKNIIVFRSREEASRYLHS